MMGSPTLVRTLIGEGLVDELRLARTGRSPTKGSHGGAGVLVSDRRYL